MYKIIDKRGTGKTARLLLTAKEKNAVFVTGCYKLYVEDLMRRFGLQDIEVISMNEFLARVYKCGRDERTYVFDEIETLASALHIVGYTDTIE